MKMKKITAVLKNCKLVDSLFNIRERQIYAALDSAKMNVEEQIANAQIKYSNQFEKLAEKDADYKCIINEMLEAKETEINGSKTLEAIDAIRKDLDSEAEIEQDDEKI